MRCVVFFFGQCLQQGKQMRTDGVYIVFVMFYRNKDEVRQKNKESWLWKLQSGFLLIIWSELMTQEHSSKNLLWHQAGMKA